MVYKQNFCIVYQIASKFEDLSVSFDLYFALHYFASIFKVRTPLTHPRYNLGKWIGKKFGGNEDKSGGV